MRIPCNKQPDRYVSALITVNFHRTLARIPTFAVAQGRAPANDRSACENYSTSLGCIERKVVSARELISTLRNINVIFRGSSAVDLLIIRNIER